ncbi:MAG: type II secretion system ATPase GspE [Mariprofundaceae bacterium]
MNRIDTSEDVPVTTMSAHKKMGELLIEAEHLTVDDLDRALRLQEGEAEDRIGVILNRLGMVSESDVVAVVAEQLGLTLVAAEHYPEFPVLEEQVSEKFMKIARVLPIEENESDVVLAMVDPLDQYTVDAFRLLTGRNIVCRIAQPSEFDEAWEQLYGSGKSAMGQIVDDAGVEDEVVIDDVEHLKDLASEAPVIRLVNLIFTHALESRASDIHIEPFENRLIVRYRIDGVLVEGESPPKRMSAAVISRVKIMAQLDIAEHRLPQDGRINMRVQGREIDLRVSTTPTMHGESVVMRILDKSGVELDYEKLGFTEASLPPFLQELKKPHGIILVTGPTGSGKTTTLYTALQTLNTPEKKILTVEDPVEYQMEGINQIQVRSKIDLTFANALRSIVRQDPDVIMIGEIRDLETAKIAVQSALTGHMVLSTLHTNSAAGTINRLLDMGMEDYLLTSTINAIVAQRLVRRLCDQCRQPYQAMPELVKEMGLDRFSDEKKVQLYHSAGCEACGETGYQGRISIMEQLTVTDEIRALVMRHAVANEIEQVAVRQGMQTMFADGLSKAVAGITTIEEILRVTKEQ